MKQLTALGMTCGVGSMLIGAKAQGYKILGNIEWRSDFNTGTFERNFPGAFYRRKISDLTDEEYHNCEGVDILIGHPDCGEYSNLLSTARALCPERKGKEDISVFTAGVRTFNPRFFVMDNLPKSLLDKPAGWWHEQCPGYDITFEYVSNYHYGNPQKQRNRLFVIGSLRDLAFYFVPGEQKGIKVDTLDTRIAGILADAPNHRSYGPDDIIPGFSRGLITSSPGKDPRKITLQEFKDYLLRENYKPGQCIPTYNAKGERHQRIGFNCSKPEHPSNVLTRLPALFKTDGTPLSVRERARIQGCPDDFIFVGSPESKLWAQTGKFMPVEFTTYITGMIQYFLLGGGSPEDYPGATGERAIGPNPYINVAKIEWCKDLGGYTNQKKACEFCGARDKCPVKQSTKN